MSLTAVDSSLSASAILSNMVNMASTASSENMEPVRRLAAQTARLLQGPALATHTEIPQAKSILTTLAKNAGPSDLAGALRDLAGNLLVNGLMESDPELKARWQESAVSLLDSLNEPQTADQARELHEVVAVQSSLLTTYRELQAAEKLSYAVNYRGIRQYRQAVSGRIKDLDRIRGMIERGETLSGRFVERWERLRIAYLGEQENGYRSKFQQHLDLLREANHTHHTTDDPLLELMLKRQEDYFKSLKEIARFEKTPTAINTATIDDALRTAKETLERSYHEAVEAYYFLKGYMPTTWRGSFSEMTREFHWTKLSSYIPPIILGGLTAVIGAFGVEPSTFDGTLYPPMKRRWEGSTLVMEPVHQTRVQGMSRRALGAGLLDTLRMQLALINTSSIDPTGGNFDGFVPTWLQGIMSRAGVSLRVEGLENLKGLRDQNVTVAPTHRGFIEYSVLMGLQDEFGHPFRIAAKDSFRTNPVILALVGLAMIRYGFFFIDRGAGQDAVRVMENMGAQLKTGNKSMVTFPSASRSPTFVFDRKRVEGPHYRAKHGIGYLIQASNDAPIVPVAIINSGGLTPKSMREQARGIPMHGTVTVKIGKPFRASELGITDTDKDQLSLSIAAKIDEQFRELTGLPTGPLYRSGPKTIFQANDMAGLDKGLKERRKKPGALRHAAVVFAPSKPYHESEPYQISALLKKKHFPQNGRLTVYHAVLGKDGRYSFPSYDIVRKGDDFEVQRAG